MNDELEPISGEEARAILEEAIRQRIGAEWENDPDGWTRVTGHDFMARLTRGRSNLDFYVDLLGEVTIEETEISPAQDVGRPLALIFLIGSALAALILARLAGYL